MSGQGTENLMRQAFAMIRRGALAEAGQMLEEICALDSGNGKAWFMRGAIRAEAGDADSAIECLSRAVGLEPGNTRAHLALCKLHASQGNLAEAIFCARQVVEQDPQHAQGWLALGSLCADAGDLHPAERASRRAMELLPGVAEAKINLANALIGRGKHDEAMVLCNRIKAEESPRAGIWHSLGLAFNALGCTSDAQECLTTVVRLDPDNAAALCALGDIKAARNEVADALSLYKKSRALNPADPRVHFQLGKVLLANSSQRHGRLVEQLQEDHLYRDVSEARKHARELATDFRFDDVAVERVLVRFFDEFDPSQLYPAAWWTDALLRFGDRRQASDTALRSIFSTVFSWSLPVRQALDGLAGFCGKRLASYGAGAGYWEWLLATHYDIDVACHDRTLRHRFVPMYETLHADAVVDPEDTVFLAWLPGDTAIEPGIEALLEQVRPGQKLIVVGEQPDRNGYPRTCGTHRIFRYLKAQFETRGTLPLVNYAWFQDRVELLVKR